MIVIVAFAALLKEVFGHGAVTKPVPRKLADAPYCPWCIGERNSGNPYGEAHLDAKPAKPCMGTKRDGPRYDTSVYGNVPASLGPSAYVAGQSFDTMILLNADHGGMARWSFCPHSEAETEECFEKNVLTEYKDVHSYWNGDSSVDHWKDGWYFPQTVSLPETVAAGRITLRWLWKCKFTDEIFASCIDVNVLASGSSTPPNPPDPVPTPAPISSPPTPQPNPTPAPSNPTPAPVNGPVGDQCSAKYEQCGGKDWTGPTCCKTGLQCFAHNEHYAQCDLSDDHEPPENCAPEWHQCGGQDWSGPTQCCSGAASGHVELECVHQSQWYSQCHPVSAAMVDATASKRHKKQLARKSSGLVRHFYEVDPSGDVSSMEGKSEENHKSRQVAASNKISRIVRADAQSSVFSQR